MRICSKEPQSMLVGGSSPTLCFWKLEAWRPLQGDLQNQGYVCTATPLIPRGTTPTSKDVSYCPRTTEDLSVPVPAKLQAFVPRNLVQDWGTECYNHSLISNFISTLQNHHPNELFLRFCSKDTLSYFFPCLSRMGDFKLF